MAFDLDDDELRATREMHKLSDKNVANEECIKILEDYLKNSAYKQSNSDFFKNGGWEIVNLEVPQAIEHILSEREQDKKKIKELEVKLECSKQLYDDCCKCLVDSIPKQLLKVKIQKLEETYKVALEKNSTEAFILRCQLEVLQELLEGGE